MGAYERFSSEREEHIDLISYANDLDTFESKFDCRKYAGDVVKSRLRSVLESSFEREFVQASSRVYFNKNLNGGNLNLLKDATTYFMDNKPLFDKVADTHVVDGMMRDKLTDVAKDVLGMSCDKVMRGEEPKVRLLAYDALRAEEEQQKSNQQGKRRVLFVQDNYDDEIENSEFDFDV